MAEPPAQDQGPSYTGTEADWYPRAQPSKLAQTGGGEPDFLDFVKGLSAKIRPDYGGPSVRGMVADTLDAAAELGHYIKGDYPLDYNPSPNALMLLAGGGGLASQAEKGLGEAGTTALGMFLGPRAQTSRLAMGTAAELASKAGATREDILRATGLFKGAEGGWRREISDVPGKLNIPQEVLDEVWNSGSVTARLGDIYDHPELYTNYPALENMPVTLKGLDPGVKGGHTAGQRVVLDPFQGGSPEELKSALSHETMHAIQGIEGWAPGGSTSVDFIRRFVPKEDWQKSIDWALERHGLPPGTKANEVDYYTARAVSLDARVHAYKSLAGEQEAFNVERRLREGGLGTKQYLEPWQTMDIPTEQQIVIPRGRPTQPGVFDPMDPLAGFGGSIWTPTGGIMR